MPKAESVRLKNGERVYARKTDNGMSFTSIEQPILLTKLQARIIIGLLIFIAVILILYLFFNTIYLTEIANILLQKITELQSVGNMVYP